MERSRASSSSCPPVLRRLLFSVFPVVSFMLRSRSGESVGPPASRYGSVTGRPRRRKGASAGVVGSGPAAPPLRRAPGGAFGLATLLEEGHLEPLAQEDLHASGDAGGEAGYGEHGSPAGLDALPAPHAQLLGVHAESLGEAAPGEAAGLLQAFEALTEVVRQDAALQGLGPVRSVVVVPVAGASKWPISSGVPGSEMSSTRRPRRAVAA